MFLSRFCFALVLSANCVLTTMKSEERSLHFAGRLLRRSEAEEQMRRPASVAMTGVAGDGKVDGGGVTVLLVAAKSRYS
jgi:hypothetical protein